MKNRIFYYDLIRALAIFGIVATHVFAFEASNMDMINTKLWYISIFFQTAQLYCVPLFIAISGALLIDKDISTKNFFKKRFNRVLLPFLFWTFIFVVISLKLNLLDGFNLNVFLSFIMGKGTFNQVLWFVWMILVVYICIFIINKLSAILTKFIYIWILLLFIGICLLITLKIINIGPIKHNLLSYILFSGYAVLGYCLSKKDPLLKREANFLNLKMNINLNAKKLFYINSISSIILLTIILILKIQLTNANHKLTSLIFFDFLVVLLVTTLFLSFRYLEESGMINIIKNSLVERVINSVSKCSYGIYFINSMVGFLFLKMLKNLNIKSNIFFNLILIFCFSWIIILIMSKIPYLNQLSGAYFKKQ